MLTNKDFIYCEDCQEYVDFYKYDHEIKNAGHDECKWRYVDDEELAGCLKDCEEEGCLNEV